MFKVKLIFNDKEFDILYSLGTKPKELALEFCSKKGAELGFTIETISQCIVPIEREITTQFGETLGVTNNNINEQINQQTIEQDFEQPLEGNFEQNIEENNSNNNGIEATDLVLDINGVNYVFQYPTNLDKTIAAKSLAEEFCNRKAYDLNIPGLAADNDDEYNMKLIKESCYDPLVDALFFELEKYEHNKNYDEKNDENDIII